jgi:serine/threonine protein kinase
MLELATKVAAAKGYSIVRPLGEGAFKSTFLVEDVHGSRNALKVLRPGAQGPRLDREIAAMQRAQHANIAKLQEYGTLSIDGHPVWFLVEEFVSGGTLREHVVATQASIPAHDVRFIAAALSDALVHLKTLNLVHRDIKPENVMLRAGPQTPVLVDFGIVRDLAEQSITQTWMAQGPGTPLYAPPEQLSNDKGLINWRADQFSLGVTLSMCAFGFHPYGHPGEDLNIAIGRVMQWDRQSNSFLDRCAATGLTPLVKMTQAWPAHRYRLPLELRNAWS